MARADSIAEHGAGWRKIATMFDRLGAPLRPTPGDVANIAAAIAGSDGHVLLLGVTAEFAPLGRELVAADNSPGMIERVWPGDKPGRRAMLADWTRLPFDRGSFSAVIGDASLNAAAGHAEQVLPEVARVLAPGGTFAIRLFCSPPVPETFAAIAADVDSGWSGNLHALKWRIAMVLAASRPDGVVAVRDILAAFDETFPDRGELARKTGWTAEEIATLDAYRGAEHSLGFPTLQHFLGLGARYFPAGRVVENAGYPLANRCPTIVWSAA